MDPVSEKDAVLTAHAQNAAISALMAAKPACIAGAQFDRNELTLWIVRDDIRTIALAYKCEPIVMMSARPKAARSTFAATTDRPKPPMNKSNAATQLNPPPIAPSTTAASRSFDPWCSRVSSRAQ